MKIIAISIFALILLATNLLIGEADEVPLRYPSKYENMVLANQISHKYEVPARTVKRIIKLESNWNEKARNLNEREDSRGLVQINRKAHPQISVTQTEDPSFAIDFLASNLSMGRGRMWSTYGK